ncbi:AbfB domain-containing protein [Marinoscillum sp. MHG1-6]|uniref:AbfB domain-containing protein n=1 Tax=Marinoscillum sp. MHG1-6 TaxID=2959627 RepID=UPI0021577DA3|nr:AbfB domain-containing protein [Marinoscillum sp. MHG1-6]
MSSSNAQEQLTDYQGTVEHLNGRNIEFSGSCNVVITSAKDPLNASTINMLSDDVWLYFPNLLPSEVASNELAHIKVNGSAAVVDQNVRVVQYLQGAMVISHSSSYQALTAYASDNLSGTSMSFDNYTFYYEAQLGSMNNNIQSFVLKKGYMATIAANADGTGESRNYVASDADVVVNSLPVGLSNAASFVRVIPWRWTTKKGYAGGGKTNVGLLEGQWHYDWNNQDISSLDVEYIPMRHNPGWNSYENIWYKTNSTAALHFNEPDNPVDDGYSTVEEAIAQWPEMLKSGLRVGTPAPTDGGVQWIRDFYDACQANNYRIDFIAIHFYRGGQTTQQFYDFLADIHNYTGLPIWITEWNNGANWTCCKPTYEEQAQTIGDWVEMLDNAPFVERYSIYEWVEDTRQMFYPGTLDFTPAGEVYRDHKSSFAVGSGIPELAPGASDGVSWESYNFPNHFIRHLNSSVRIDQNVSPADDKQWTMVPGLADPNGVSFESVNNPGTYLRHFNYVLTRGTVSNSLEEADATFYIRQGLADAAWTSFESYNFPGYYMRHSNFVLRIDQVSNQTEFQDATFQMHELPQVPNQDPIVYITSPVEGTAYQDGANVSITAQSYDNDGNITQVEFFVDGGSIGFDTTSPYTASWIIGTGNFSLTAVATDDSLAVTTSSPINISGSATPNVLPFVDITSPVNGTSFSDGTNITISASASDSDGTVTQVEFFVDGISIGIDKTSPYEMNWVVGTGNFSITAVATDNALETTSSSVGVTGICGPSAITPYYQINYGTWVIGTEITINQGDVVGLGPQPFDGTWSWSGCGTSGSEREQYITLSSSCLPTAVHTNYCGTQNSVKYNITVNTGGPYMFVQSVTTGTIGAGKGSKYGYADVTILDDQSNPVANANVIGTFSGSWNETVSGTTNASGVVTLQTTSTLKGGVVVDLCVDDVSHGSLSYNVMQNVVTCSNGGARSSLGGDEAFLNAIKLYPNPVTDVLNIALPADHLYADLSIIDLFGRSVLETQLTQPGNKLDLGALKSGIYFVHVKIGGSMRTMCIIKD